MWSSGYKTIKFNAKKNIKTLFLTTDWSPEVLQLAEEFRDRGVVGIDIAGNEEMTEESSHSFTDKDVETFRRAKELGIHRTCHAGEAGPALNVAFAVDKMCAERIGHGYSVIKDNEIYLRCLKSSLHFETCPHSSYFTGAISPYDRNSIVQFAEDGANFSISKDDPITFGSTLDKEYQYLSELGLNEVHIIRAVSLQLISHQLKPHLFSEHKRSEGFLFTRKREKRTLETTL